MRTNIAKNSTWSSFKLRALSTGLLALASFSATGCYAPLLSPGIPARELPDSFRTPMIENQPRLNLAELTIPHTSGSVTEGDLLEIRVHGLQDGAAEPIQVRVLDDGTISLPLIGTIQVAGKRLPNAQKQIVDAYEGGGFLKTPQVALQIAEPAMVEVVVMGQVNQPGVYSMPRNSADVGRAIALAGGLTTIAGDTVEVHRNARPQVTNRPVAGTLARQTVFRGQSPGPNGRLLRIAEASFTKLDDADKLELPNTENRPGTAWKTSPIVGGPLPGRPMPSVSTLQSTGEKGAIPATVVSRHSAIPETNNPTAIRPGGVTTELIGRPDDERLPPSEIHIPLRGFDIRGLDREEVRLHDGDVVQVPKRKDQVFYVVGPLNQRGRQTFNVSDRELREIGGGFLLPLDRDIDVVTGVAMAGYIDPIASPTTVTVQRKKPNGEPMLIIVDLIAARSDQRETILLRSDDIVYLNPDGAWWSRRFFDQVAPQIFTLPYRFWIQDLIVPTASPL